MESEDTSVKSQYGFKVGQYIGTKTSVYLINEIILRSDVQRETLITHSALGEERIFDACILDQQMQEQSMTILSEVEAKVIQENVLVEALRQRGIEEEKRKLAEQAEREAKQKQALLETKRKELLSLIKNSFTDNFLNTDASYESQFSNLLTFEEYKDEKVAYIREWFKQPPNLTGDGNLPDDEQALAIASVNGNVQVTARAGSGKTDTLIKRAQFLLMHCGVAPGQMLILAFNRKAVMEIRRRLLKALHKQAADVLATEIKQRKLASNGKRNTSEFDELEQKAIEAVASQLGLTLPYVMTFHSLAYAVVHPGENIIYDDSSSENQSLSAVIQKIIDEHRQNPEFVDTIRELMMAHFRDDWERFTQGGYDLNKEEIIKYRRSLPHQSLRGEYVKSFGEKVIADFLFIHDIKYKYEHNHWWNGQNYRPDFTIEKSNKFGVIIEYFGLKGDADYDEMSEAKREYWQQQDGWQLIEFSPQDISASKTCDFELTLKRLLEEYGITYRRLSEDEIWKRLKERAIDRFTKAMVSFVGRCRKLTLSPNELVKMVQSHGVMSPAEERFLRIGQEIYQVYLDRLAAEFQEDFDGLMQRAAECIDNYKTTFDKKLTHGDLAKIRYLFIDEFQDFSPLFYNMVQSIVKVNAKVQFFCVGDDWQSINGFAGSDLKYFRDFQRYIGEAKQLPISRNYRSARAIVNISNALMYGLGIPAVANQKEEGRVLLCDLSNFEPSFLEDERYPGDVITPAVFRLVKRIFNAELSLVLLCRQNRVPWYFNHQYKAGDTNDLDVNPVKLE
jgi:DNA helicase-4